MWVVLCDLFSIHIAPQLACIFTYGGLFHMYRFRLFTHQGFERSSVPGLKLLVFWFAGLFLGIFAVRFCGGTFVSSLSAAAGQRVSAAILPLTLFPLLVSAAAVLIFPYSVLYGICFFRSFSLGLTLQGVCVCFHGCAALAASLLLFSGLAFSPVLLWFWWRRLAKGQASCLSDTLICTVVGMAISLADLWIVSPFLADIVNF